jgi:hypothetical protein
MGALEHNLADGRGAFPFARISIEHLDYQRVTYIEVDVRKGDMLPTPGFRHMDQKEGTAIVEKADRFDASEIPEGTLRMKAPVGEVDSVEGRSVQLPR